MKAATFARLQELRAANTPVALLTNLRNGSQLIVTRSGTEGDLCLDIDMIVAAQEAIKTDESTSFETPAGKIFVHVFAPPPRLVVVGAVHIAETLARMAALTGYGVTIIDPRRSFAASQGFGSIEVSGDWPDEAMEKLKPDMRTAVVTLTHDPKLDDPALHPRGWTLRTIGARLAAGGDPWRDIAAHARSIGPARRALGRG